MGKITYGITEKVPASLLLPLSLQHTFAMFGASVLVPSIFGIDVGTVLLMNGFGTLLFIFITKGKAPAYLGSSFAFLGPAGIIKTLEGDFSYVQGAIVVVGLLGCIIALLIWKFGTDWIDILLPPAAMGPVVALVGFELSGLTVRGGKIGANIMPPADPTMPLPTTEDVIVFMVTLGTAIIGSIAFKKFLATIPILISIVVGYITAIILGIVDLSPIMEAEFFTLPKFSAPTFSVQACLTMIPVLLVITSEHISHQVVTSNIVGTDLLKEPGLHRSIFADNLSTAISGLVGGAPTTTYGENIGVMAITGVYSVQVIAGAAVISILMAFIGPLSAFITTIPGDVIGGVTFLLYGMIGVSGIRLLVDKKVDYSKPINLVTTSVVFVAGLSNVSLNLAGIELKGMVLASVVAVVINFIFFILKKFDLFNA